MIEIEKRFNRRKRFKDLAYGDTFLYGNWVLYMKMKVSNRYVENAVALLSGDTIHIDDNDMTIAVDTNIIADAKDTVEGYR